MTRNAFAFVIEPISAERHARMTGASWHPHPACPPLSQLALVRMSHWGMDGAVHPGELIVAARVARDVVEAFRRIFEARFAIERMVAIDAYAGDDDASMAANNCSGFNFRIIAGTDQLSQHSYGTAIDINPVQNPWIREGRYLPPQGAQYADRTDVRPGMIVRPGPVTDAFDAIGWEWGGDWEKVKDYHHVAARD